MSTRLKNAPPPPPIVKAETWPFFEFRAVFGACEAPQKYPLNRILLPDEFKKERWFSGPLQKNTSWKKGGEQGWLCKEKYIYLKNYHLRMK